MITSREKVVVGTFVVATSVLLVGLLGILWGIRASKPHKRYYVVTDTSVAGLGPSSPVKYLGVDVGHVEEMSFDDSTPPKVKLTLAVFLDTPVKVDTKAQLTPQGITGIQFIELIRGLDKKDLAPGKTLDYIPSQFTDLVTRIGNLSGNADVFLKENKARIAQTIDHADQFLLTATGAVVSAQTTLDRLATQADALVAENRVALRETLASARATLDDVQKLAASFREQGAAGEITGAIRDARRGVAEITSAVADLRAQLASPVLSDSIAEVRSTARAASEAAVAARDLLTRVGGHLEDDLDATARVLDQLNRTARSLEELSREVKDRPALLLRDLERGRREVVDK